LDDILFKFRPDQVEKIRTGLLGCANIWLAVWFEDIFWFLFRIASPLVRDSLGGKWIQVVGVDGLPEWTARWGYFAFNGNAVPYWYVISTIILSICYCIVFFKPDLLSRKRLQGLGRLWVRSP
jgi:hypothetical protein